MIYTIVIVLLSVAVFLISVVVFTIIFDSIVIKSSDSIMDRGLSSNTQNLFSEQSMSLNEYQQFCGRSANSALDPKLDLAVLALGVAGEGGEVVDHIKKHVAHGHELDKEKLVKELGDTLWYIATLSSAIGYSLHDVARINIEKLMVRYQDGFSEEASKKRVDEK